MINRVLAFALLASFSLASAIPASAADMKVGFVDVPKILDTAPQAKQARSSIDREFAPRDRKLVAQQKELRGLEDRLIRDREVMSAPNRGQLEGEIRTLKRELRRAQDEFREDLNRRRNQELLKLQKKVISAIRTLAKEQKYDLIISDGVLFAGDRVEMTSKVLDRLQRDFKK